MRSVGSVDGKDAELHSPVTSPHSNTSGNVSDLSDSSFNISDFLGEKTDNLKKMPPKDEAQGHDEGQGHLEKQGQVGRVFTNGEAKENVEPLNANNNSHNSKRRIVNKDEHIPESVSQLNQGSNHSTASCSQQSGESTKPAETYISLIAKVIKTLIRIFPFKRSHHITYIERYLRNAKAFRACLHGGGRLSSLGRLPATLKCLKKSWDFLNQILDPLMDSWNTSTKLSKNKLVAVNICDCTYLLPPPPQ